jgi:hypothetical protein
MKAKINRGFEPPAGRTVIYDRYPVPCGGCGKPVPEVGSHIVCHPAGADLHVMYCPGCCPCVST